MKYIVQIKKTKSFPSHWKYPFL